MNFVLIATAVSAAFMHVDAQNDLQQRTLDEVTRRQIRYLHFTRVNPDKYSEIRENRPCTAGKLSPNKTTCILAHGYVQSPHSPPIKRMVQAFLTNSTCNVICVDWSNLVRGDYLSARLLVPAAGREVAKFINFLMKRNKTEPERLHLVGHSLGAHMMGVAATNSNGTPQRLTGLDPAGPGFEPPTSDRLNTSRAKFVDVIHTSNSLGLSTRCGHLDYYPNGGKCQPGCLGIPICCHERSTEIFSESIEGGQFMARRCASWEEFTRGSCDGQQSDLMGQWVSSSLRGKFYGRTAATSPYALG